MTEQVEAMLDECLRLRKTTAKELNQIKDNLAKVVTLLKSLQNNLSELEDVTIQMSKHIMEGTAEPDEEESDDDLGDDLDALKGLATNLLSSVVLAITGVKVKDPSSNKLEVQHGEYVVNMDKLEDITQVDPGTFYCSHPDVKPGMTVEALMPSGEVYFTVVFGRDDKNFNLVRPPKAWKSEKPVVMPVRLK